MLWYNVFYFINLEYAENIYKRLPIQLLENPPKPPAVIYDIGGEYA